MPRYGGSGQGVTIKGVPTNVFTLAAGQVSLALPPGDLYAETGLYTTLQQLDPITGIWRGIGGGSTFGNVAKIFSDGNNYRFANQSGCAVGALLTNGGTGYLAPPLVVASAGNSLWQAFVGGAVASPVI